MVLGLMYMSSDLLVRTESSAPSEWGRPGSDFTDAVVPFLSHKLVVCR